MHSTETAADLHLCLCIHVFSHDAAHIKTVSVFGIIIQG